MKPHLPARNRTLVIVPAYNEAAVIWQTVTGLLHAGWKVVVVDDGSTDDTTDRLRDVAIHYIRHEINLGQGAALMTGMVYANRAGADFVVHFDADGQHRVADIDRMIAVLENGAADIVMGSRFLDRESRSKVPFSRRILLKTAVLVNFLYSGLWLTDAHNGLRAMNRLALEKIKLRENGMAHATEILTEIRKHKLRWKEIPVEVVYSPYARGKGQSALDALGILTDLMIRKLFF
ncbi:MAG: glycosyltransferase family 2 protein [Bacteroidia bacterium]